jgi:hypothetical protein
MFLYRPLLNPKSRRFTCDQMAKSADFLHTWVPAAMTMPSGKNRIDLSKTVETTGKYGGMNYGVFS